MQFESLIFDIDGTLWDSRALVAEGYNIQLRAEGLQHLCVTAEDLKKLFGKTMTDIADILLATVPQSERYDLLERCMEQEQKILHNDPCHIGYPKVKETLQELAKKHRLFIVSNSQSGYPQLCINGEIQDGLAYITYLTENNRYIDFAKAGYRLFSVPVFFGYNHLNERSGLNVFKKGIFDKDEPDFSIFDEDIIREGIFQTIEENYGFDGRMGY